MDVGGDFLGTKKQEEHSKRIEQFHTMCKDTLTFKDEQQSFVPVNRFMCMDRLEQAIQRKKGAYSEEERLNWLYIMNTCLAAPDCYFSERLKEKSKKLSQKFEKKLKLFQRELALHRSWNSGIYTYISCLRDYLRNPAVSPDEPYPYALDMKEALEQALQAWVIKNPHSGKIRKIYHKRLIFIFQRNQARLNHPMYFLFLPYYIFWKLIQSEEDDLDEAKAFSKFVLNQKALSWSVRSSPIKIYNASDLKWMQELYDVIEETLCKVLQSKNYSCIGKWTWLTTYKYARVIRFLNVNPLSVSNVGFSKFGMVSQDSAGPMKKEEKQETWVEESVYFSAPLWRYQIWTERFKYVFGAENQCLEDDLQNLFSLVFRPESRQTKQGIENIRGKYQNAHAILCGTEYKLFDLMAALAAIYNPAYFNHENVFSDENHELIDAITLLMGFVNACDDKMAADRDSADENTEESDNTLSDPKNNRKIDLKWLHLLREGFPKTKRREFDIWGDPDNFLINPSRELVQALFTRSIANSMNSDDGGSPEIQNYFYETEILGTRFAYDTPIQSIHSTICNALPSLKNLTCDAFTWGGIKEVGESYSSLRKALRIWKFRNPEDVSTCLRIAECLRNKPSLQKELIGKLQDINFKPKKIRISANSIFEFNFSATKRLSNPKKIVIELLPAGLREKLKPPTELDDFYYMVLLYTIFSVLRERMCLQAYALSLKLLPFA